MARTLVAASSQKLSVASAPVTAVPLTMACWYKPTASAQYPIPFCLDDGSFNNAFFLEQDLLTLHCNSMQGGTQSYPTSSGLTLNAWNHICGVFASSTSRSSYVNGGSKATNTASSTPASIAAIGIGDSSNGSGHCNADVAEYAIWNVALSDNDVADLAKGLAAYLVRPDALKFYAPLLQGYSPEIELIGARNLTLSNAPAYASHPPIRYRSIRQ